MSPTLHSTSASAAFSATDSAVANASDLAADAGATSNRLAAAPGDMSDILSPLGLLQPKLARIESIAMRTIGAVVIVGGLGFLLVALLSTPS